MVPRLQLIVLLAASTYSSACGGSTPSVEEAQRSDREYDLGRALEEEKNIPGAIEHLGTALKLDPTNVRAHLLLGYIHNNREDFPAAEKQLREGIGLLEKRPDMASTLAEARNLLGVVLMRQHKPKAAIPLFKQSASDMLNQAPWYAWGNLGWAYYEQKQYREAEEALRQAVRVQPRFCLGYYWLGRTFFDRNDYGNADKALTSALEVDERCKGVENQSAWRWRGETRAQLGQREDAIQDFERCVELGGRTEDGLACQRFLQ